MASEKTRSREIPTVKRPVAFLFELEASAVDGRNIMYGVCKRLFGERDADFTEDMYKRFCSMQYDEQRVAVILDKIGKKRLSAGKLADEIMDAWEKEISAGRMKRNALLCKIIDDVHKRGGKTGAISSLDRETAVSLMEKAGFDAALTALFPVARDGRDFPTADAWLKLAKSMAVPALGSTALVTSAVAAKAAL